MARRIRGSESLIRVARTVVEARFRDALAFLGASDLGLTPGSLRGGVATSMLMHQCDISTVRHQLRHTDEKNTFRYVNEAMALAIWVQAKRNARVRGFAQMFRAAVHT